MEATTTEYVLSRSHYKTLLEELKSEENIITYINEVYSLCHQVTDLIITED